MASINITYVRRPCRDRQAVSFYKCVLCALCGKRLWQAVQENTNKRGELTLQGDTAVNLCGRAFYLFILFHKTIYCPHTYCVLVGCGMTRHKSIHTYTHKYYQLASNNILEYSHFWWIIEFPFTFIQNVSSIAAKTFAKHPWTAHSYVIPDFSCPAVWGLCCHYPYFTLSLIFSVAGPSITAGPEPALFFLSALLL